MVRGTLRVTAVSVSKLNYHEKVFGDFKDKYEKNMHLVFYLLKHFCHVTDIMGIWCDKVVDSWKCAEEINKITSLSCCLHLYKNFYYIMDWKFLFACLFVFSMRNRLWKKIGWKQCQMHRLFSSCSSHISHGFQNYLFLQSMKGYKVQLGHSRTQAF